MSFKSLLVCCCLLAAASASQKKNASNLSTLESRIIGGRVATRGEFPHQVSLQVTNVGHICGGSIINEYWIITTAFCVVGVSDVIYVKAGLNQLLSPENSLQISRVAEKFVYPDYPSTPQVAPYDIALLKLAIPFSFNVYVRPVELPRQNEGIYESEATLSGWGSIDPNGVGVSHVLQKVSLPFIQNSVCKKNLESLGGAHAPIEPSNICTGPLSSGKSACNGDYGGPLVTYTTNGKPKLIGLASWGLIPCATYTGATVYTRVSSYRAWISSTINNN